MTPAASASSTRSRFVTSSVHKRENWDERRFFASSFACTVTFSACTPRRTIKTRHSLSALSHDEAAARLSRSPASSGAQKEASSCETGWILGPHSFPPLSSTGETGGKVAGRIYMCPRSSGTRDIQSEPYRFRNSSQYNQYQRITFYRRPRTS